MADRSLFIEIRQKGYRRSEPHGVSRETSQVFRQGLQIAPGIDAWSRPTWRKSYGYQPRKLNRIILGLVLTPVEGNRESDSGQSQQKPEPRLVQLPSPHRARAALRAISERFLAESFAARAGPTLSPPRRPNSTAAGFFSGSWGSAFSSLVASSTRAAARAFRSRGGFLQILRQSVGHHHVRVPHRRHSHRAMLTCQT
jgi:hypothetical protein